MKQVINIYKRHKLTVDMYLKNLVKSFERDFFKDAVHLLEQHKFIELIYGVDEDFKQVTPIICKKKEDSENIGANKSHYFHKMILDDDMFYVSNPYIHYRTGKASLSVVYYKNDIYHVFDVNLIDILEELKLIEFNQFHDMFKRTTYLLGSSTLALVSIVLISYGIYFFVSMLLDNPQVDLLHDIFKSIIAVTLGLAIFDLAKQIFEHEVLFQTLEQDDDKQYKVLGKFLVSIIIALSIETLLVVFKVALSNSSEGLISAFFLILATTIMFTGLGWFYKTIKQSGCSFNE